jgi:hypothetical protein
MVGYEHEPRDYRREDSDTSRGRNDERGQSGRFQGRGRDFADATPAREDYEGLRSSTPARGYDEREFVREQRGYGGNSGGAWEGRGVRESGWSGSGGESDRERGGQQGQYGRSSGSPYERPYDRSYGDQYGSPYYGRQDRGTSGGYGRESERGRDTWRQPQGEYSSAYGRESERGRDSRGSQQGQYSSAYDRDTDRGRESGRQQQGSGFGGTSFEGAQQRGFYSRNPDEEGGYRGKGPKGYRRSDERIKEDIQDRLTDDDGVDASDVEVAVKDGEVTLSGTVPSRHCKRCAEEIAENVSGVQQVLNSIKVKPASESGQSGDRNVRSQGTTSGSAVGQTSQTAGTASSSKSR